MAAATGTIVVAAAGHLSRRTAVVADPSTEFAGAVLQARQTELLAQAMALGSLRYELLLSCMSYCALDEVELQGANGRARRARCTLVRTLDGRTSIHMLRTQRQNTAHP